MPKEDVLEKGQKCWRFWHGNLSIVEIKGTVGPVLGYIFKTLSGFDEGENGTGIPDTFYRFPEDSGRLLSDIDKEIESMRMYKSQVILKRHTL